MYKKGDYGGAVGCYTASIEAKWSCVGYANRAMALLKLGQFEDAEKDCTMALDMDASYVKAWSRRGTARRYITNLFFVFINIYPFCHLIQIRFRNFMEFITSFNI